MKSTPFQTKHTLEFSLEVVAKDAKGDVTKGRVFTEVLGSKSRN
jgi:hypothetical protein